MPGTTKNTLSRPARYGCVLLASALAFITMTTSDNEANRTTFLRSVSSPSTEDSTATLLTEEEEEEEEQQPNTTPISTSFPSTSTTSPTTTIKKKLYVKARPDQSGRQFLHFFRLDAAAKSKGYDIGGACIVPEITFEKLPEEKAMQHIEEAQQLLKYFGLDKRYTYECPTDEDLASGRAEIIGNKMMAKEAERFLMEHETDEEEVAAQDWFASLNSQLSIPSLPKVDKWLRVAVHVRRGDIYPCNNRYLSNAFYHRVLDEYLPQYCGEDIEKNCKVTVYSQSKTFESFSSFEERGYHLDLDSSLEKTWTDFIQADVFFIAESAFSFAPAILNKNVVLYTGRGIEFGQPKNWVITDPIIRKGSGFDDEVCNAFNGQQQQEEAEGSS